MQWANAHLLSIAVQLFGTESTCARYMCSYLGLTVDQAAAIRPAGGRDMSWYGRYVLAAPTVLDPKIRENKENQLSRT